MVYKDLTFLLFAKDMGTREAFAKVSESGDKMAHGISGSMGMVGLAVAGAAIAIGAKSVEMAAAFESATTRLVTDAGTSQAQLGMVKKGILDISSATGTAATDVAGGMYVISSAGFTGAAGLNVLHAATEGAKVGYADLHTVSDALTTVLTDFAGKNVPTATEAMNGLIATVSHGKTTMEALAGSLHSVLPAANLAGLGLNQVLGAMATMTGEGISADQAAQNLNHAISSLTAPSQVAKDAMAGVGLSSLDVAKNLGPRGLTGTYELMTEAIAKHTKGGLVALNLYNTSAQAAASFKVEIAGLPPALRATATAFENGHVTAKQWAHLLKDQPATIANLGRQFATTVKHAEGFNSAVKNGDGPARTFNAQLEKMTGGITGMGVAAHLTGTEHMGTFKSNVDSIGGALKTNGKHVTDWGTYQKTLNAELDRGKVSMDNAGIAIGTALMPALKEIVPEIPKVADAIVGMVGAIGVGVTGFNKWVNDVRASVAVFLRDLGKDFDRTVKYFTTIPAELSQIGGQIVDGLVNGLTGNFGKVASVVANLANMVPKYFRDLLGIHSPSKVFFDIGMYVGQGLQNGLLGSVANVRSASSTLAGEVISAFQRKHATIGAGTENSLLHLIAGDEKSLSSLSANRASLQKKLGTLTTSRTGVVDATRNATLGYGDVTAYPAVGDAVGGLRALVGKTRTFSSDLQSLMKKGVSGAMLTQLVNGWNSNPDTALATANGLLANPGDLKQIMGLERQLTSAAGGLASMAGNAEYGSQIAATSGKIKVDTWRMQQIARNEARQVAGGLHVTVNLSGTYAGTNASLAKSISQLLREEVRKGTIPKNWATG